MSFVKSFLFESFTPLDGNSHTSVDVLSSPVRSFSLFFCIHENCQTMFTNNRLLQKLTKGSKVTINNLNATLELRYAVYLDISSTFFEPNGSRFKQLLFGATNC